MTMNDRLRMIAGAFADLDLHDSLDLVANVLKYLVLKEVGKPSMGWGEFAALTIDLKKSHPDTLVCAVAQQANLIAYWLSESKS